MASRRQSKLDQLITHCDFISEHCSSIPGEVGQQLARDCKELLESGKLIDAMAAEFTFEDLPTNGFVLYLTLVTAYVELIEQQIKQNKIDFELLNMVKLVFLYRDGLLDTYRDLKKEKETLNGKEQHLIVREKRNLRSRFQHELVN